MTFASYFDVDAETDRVLDVPLEMTRAALGLVDGFANGIIARQIVELARTGERNPELLCEGALKKLRGGRCSETNEGSGRALSPESADLLLLARRNRPICCFWPNPTA
jgi:hypothetical protein